MRILSPPPLFPETDGVPAVMPALWDPIPPEIPAGSHSLVLVSPFVLDNCAPANSADEVAGNVMLFPATLGWGDAVTPCSNSMKSNAAELLGAAGVIFIDSTSESGFGGTAYSFPVPHTGSIPGWTIERSQGLLLASLVQNGTAVTLEMYQKRVQQRDLEAMWDLFNDHNGPNWTYLIPGVLEATWFELGSLERGARPTLDVCQFKWPLMLCDPDGYIIAYGATAMTLGGGFPASLLDFERILRITVTDASLSGPLPEDIGDRLPQLLAINVNDNQLNGDLPASMAKMTRMRELDIATNGFTGDALASIVEAMPDLVTCTAASNDLSGSVPTVWPKGLRVLDLSANSLSGELTSDFSLVGGSLVTLDLTNNQLSGQLPDLSSFTSISTMRIGGNAFSGAFPPSIGLLTNVHILDMSDNALQGDISAVSFAGLTDCTELYLNGNELSGAVPTALPPSVRTVDLSDNRFTSIGDIRHLLDLRRLFLNDNEITDDIYTFISNMPPSSESTRGIEIINVANNHLWANLTAPFVLLSFSNLAAISRIDLSNNELRGRLLWQTGIDEVTLLEQLVMRDNAMLSGSVPPIFGEMKSLRELDFRGTAMRHLDFGADGVPTELDQSNAVHPFVQPSGSIALEADLNLWCPGLELSASGGLLLVDPEYHNFALCRCDVGFRRTVDATGRPSCARCAEHIVCPGFDNDANFVIESGFYPTPSIDDPQDVIQCADSIFGETACNPDNKSPFECKDGHEDRLCAACVDGYFRRGSDCLECRPVGILLATGGSILIAAIVLILLLRLRPSNRAVQRAVERMKTKRQDGQLGLRPSDSDLTSSGTEFVAIGGRAHTYVSNKPMRLLTLALISITYVQLVTLAQVDLTLPVTLAALDAIYDIFNMTLRSFGWDCVASSLTIEEQYGVILLMPLLLCAFVGTVSAIYASLIRDAIRRRVTLNMGMGACLLVLNLFYFPMSRQTLATVRCSADPVTDEAFFDTDPHIACDEISGGFKAVSIVFYPAGVLLLLALLIARDRKKLNHPYVRLRVGFLCHGFFDDYWYVPIVLLARRTVLAVVISLIKPGSGLRPLFIVVVLNMTLFFILLVRPYRNVFANMLDTLCSVAIVIIYTGSLALSNDSLEDHRGGVETVTFAVHVLTLLTILFFLVWRLRYSIVTWRADRIAKSRDADVETRLQDAPGGAAGRGLDAEAAHGLEMEMGTVAWSEDTSSSRERSAKSDDSRQFSAEFSGLAGSSSASSASTGSTSSTNASSSSSS